MSESPKTTDLPKWATPGYAIERLRHAIADDNVEALDGYELRALLMEIARLQVRVAELERDIEEGAAHEP